MLLLLQIGWSSWYSFISTFTGLPSSLVNRAGWWSFHQLHSHSHHPLPQTLFFTLQAMSNVASHCSQDMIHILICSAEEEDVIAKRPQLADQEQLSGHGFCAHFQHWWQEMKTQTYMISTSSKWKQQKTSHIVMPSKFHLCITLLSQISPRVLMWRHPLSGSWNARPAHFGISSANCAGCTCSM